MAGAGCNFQRHCRKAVFVGIGFKFHDFIQADPPHPPVRPGRVVEIDVIYADSEREVRRELSASGPNTRRWWRRWPRSSASSACRARPWPTS
jgi:hypothetical protein